MWGIQERKYGESEVCLHSGFLESLTLGPEALSVPLLVGEGLTCPEASESPSPASKEWR